MVNGVNSPLGLVPVKSMTSATFVENVFTFQIASGYSTSIYVGEPVTLLTTGYINAVASGSTPVLGVFMGCEYIQNGTKNTTANGYWPASTAFDAGTICVAKVLIDPTIVYSIQYDSTPTQNMLGGNIGYTAEGTTQTNGFSTIAATGSVATTITLPLKIIGLDPTPGNAWGTAYSNLLVMINNQQLAPNTLGLA